MLKRMLTALLLIAFGVGVFLLRSVWPIAFEIAVCLVMLVAVHEMATAMKEHVRLSQRILLYLTVLATLPVSRFFGLIGLFVTVFLSLTAQLLLLLFDHEITLTGIGLYALMLFYPILFLSLYYVLHAQGSNSEFLMIGAIALACMSDAFAYFVGSLIKGPKLCPSISPKKTISGAVGGIFGAVAGIFATYGALLLIGIPVTYSIAAIAVAGVIGGLFTEAGDLVESALKRRVGIKDFGNLLPGHGGVMDRLDSILFNTLFMWGYFCYLVPLLGI